LNCKAILLRLIRCRQFAVHTGNGRIGNKTYRKATQRLGKKLRQQYYNKQVSRLRQLQIHVSGGKYETLFVGPTCNEDRNELEGIARDLYDGDVDRMAEDINHFFVNIASDILPLCDDILTSLNTAKNDGDHVADYRTSLPLYKRKNEFVGGKYSTTPSPFCPQIEEVLKIHVNINNCVR